MLGFFLSEKRYFGTRFVNLTLHRGLKVLPPNTFHQTKTYEFIYINICVYHINVTRGLKVLPSNTFYQTITYEYINICVYSY